MGVAAFYKPLRTHLAGALGIFQIVRFSFDFQRKSDIGEIPKFGLTRVTIAQNWGGVGEFCKKNINNHYQHVPPASVPPRDDHSDLRINQVAGRGRVSDFGENRTKIGKIGHRGGENRDLS